MKKIKNPLEPLSSVVAIALVIVAASLVVGVIATLDGGGFGFGLGDSQVCTTVGSIGMSYEGSGRIVLTNVVPGVDARAFDYLLCDPTPDVGQRIWGVLAELPTFVMYAVALLAVARTVTVATRHGLYHPSAVRWVRRLGWLLLIGGPLATALAATARTVLLGDMVTFPVGVDAMIQDWAFPATVVLTGAGLLSFARIMAIGIRMREDLEGTV